ncbi:protein containing DUF164 [Candidatus Magnetomorum sp. HK-1]|nr:protein containing DUF164 [Candidatus Magnetomorum sp. HK-1]
MDIINETLCQLQEIDLQYRSIDNQLKSSPQSILELETNLKTLETKLADAKNIIDTCLKKQRTYESDIKDNDAHIKRSKEKTTSIKSNKEYQALLKEIDDTEKKNAELEEEVIKCMYEQESTSESIKGEEEKIKKMRQQLKKEKKAFEVRRKDIEKRFNVLKAERDITAAKLPKKVIERYEFLCKVGKGIGIGFVEKGTCSACHTNIPAQYVIELRKTQDIQYCLTCQRFLIWKEDKQDTSEEL